MTASTPTYELIAKKDREAVRALYERYGKKLFGYAAHKWKLNEDANWELVYKTLYRVIETFSDYTFSSEERFSAFVFTVFINYLRNHYRDKKNLPREIMEIDEKMGEMVTENEAQISPSVKLLSEELDKLEDWERILLLMRGQEIPYSEIAKYVDKPEEQLKVYYQRLRKKLEERMREKLAQLKTASEKNK